MNLGSLTDQGFLEPRVSLANLCQLFEPRRVLEEADLQEAVGLNNLESSS